MFAIITAATMACGILLAPVSETNSYQKGDVNMDGVVDVADAQLALLEYTFAIVGVDYGLKSEQLELASITGSMTKIFNSEQVIPIGVSDAQVILRYATDRIAQLQVPNDIQSYYEQMKQKEHEIKFTVVEAYNSIPDTDERHSCVILNNEQLRQNPVQPVKAYSGSFFEDHALIFVGVKFSNWSDKQPEVSKISYDMNTIHIRAVCNDENDFGDSEQWWCVFLEILKSDVIDLNENIVFDIDVRNQDDAPAKRKILGF